MFINLQVQHASVMEGKAPAAVATARTSGRHRGKHGLVPRYEHEEGHEVQDGERHKAGKP